MNRHQLRTTHGSVTYQALQVVVEPVLAAVHTISRGLAYATTPTRDSRSIDNPPPDVDVSEVGSCRNELTSTPSVGSRESRLSLEENLPNAPALTINPRLIAAIPEVPLPEKLEVEDLQNAVVHENSKLFQKTKGLWVAELLSERTK